MNFCCCCFSFSFVPYLKPFTLLNRSKTKALHQKIVILNKQIIFVFLLRSIYLKIFFFCYSFSLFLFFYSVSNTYFLQIRNNFFFQFFFVMGININTYTFCLKEKMVKIQWLQLLTLFKHYVQMFVCLFVFHVSSWLCLTVCFLTRLRNVCSCMTKIIFNLFRTKKQKKNNNNNKNKNNAKKQRKFKRKKN